MGQEQAIQLLQQGIAAARAGQTETARNLLRQAARLDPQNETTWMWLTSVAADTNERIFCLKRILEINPYNERAIQGLQSLSTQADAPRTTPPPTPAPRRISSIKPLSAPSPEESEIPAAPQGISIPVVDEQTNTRLQQEADDFLRRYNPEPIDRLQIEWTRKQRRRYAEMGEQRMRRVIMAVAAFVIVGVIVGAVVLVNQFDISLGGDEVAVVNTRVLSPTPTLEFTPTPGGDTPTPFPSQMAVGATVIPSGLVPQGSPYDLKQPTEMYPPANSLVKFVVDEAVDLYVIGDYEAAIEKLRTERESEEPNCYPSLVYFEALSLAAQGDYRDATALLNDAVSTEPERIYESCRDSALLIAGLGEVAYLQDNESQTALNYAEDALARDPRLVQAMLTQARVEYARGQYQTAWLTLQDALNEYPEDTNVLLLFAQVELASGEPTNALNYIGQALFIEPVLPEALYLQAEAYLAAAEQAPAESTQRIQYYGLAVKSAQTLLMYYEGDPAGYLYLAQARLGEGNDDLAEEALTRILAVADTLPESVESVVREAQRIRGYMYYNQARYQEAWDDLEPIAVTRGTFDSAIAETLVDIAFHLEQYADALKWLDQLRFEDSDNAAHVLLDAKIRVEICTFRTDLPCQYDDMLDVLDDDFIDSLPSELQRADARSYRAQALYGDALERDPDEDEQTVVFSDALRDLEQALAVREHALDHYYRATILDALGDPVEAVKEYQWLAYWNDQYTYPFVDSAFEDRVAEVASEAQDIIESQATDTPTPQPTTTATPTPTPTLTPSPTVTPSPTPSPTAVPPVSIP